MLTQAFFPSVTLRDDEKWEAIQYKVVGSEADQKKLQKIRVNMRRIYGSKLVREVVYK